MSVCVQNTRHQAELNKFWLNARPDNEMHWMSNVLGTDEMNGRDDACICLILNIQIKLHTLMSYGAKWVVVLDVPPWWSYIGFSPIHADMPIFLFSTIRRWTIATLALWLPRSALFANRAVSANAKRGLSYPFMLSYTYLGLFPRSSDRPVSHSLWEPMRTMTIRQPLKPWKALTFLYVTPFLGNICCSFLGRGPHRILIRFRSHKLVRMRFFFFFLVDGCLTAMWYTPLWVLLLIYIF